MYSSFVYVYSEKIDPIVLKHVMQQHQVRAITSDDDEDITRIHVRRSHIFEDSMRQFSKDSFNTSKMLKVLFIGESAVDDGGLSVNIPST